MTTYPGYLLPSVTEPILPKQLDLIQFIQTILVGISGLPGPMVRPSWQTSPPKEPDISVDWIGFGVSENNPDVFSFLGTDNSGVTTTQTQSTLLLSCSIYGPNALSTYDLIRDGFEIPQNLYALRSASMGLIEISRALNIPELVNERWRNRYQLTIALRREIQRTYPIPVLISAHGVIHTVLGNEQYLLDWATQT